MKTIYKNGRVYTGSLPLVDAFLVEDNHFISVGSNRDAQNWQADSTVDLHGAFVCAGFNDSHMHLLNFGQSLMMAPLYKHTSSLEDMLDCLKEHLRANPPLPGQWLEGRGWNQDYFTDLHRMPNRHDLDQVSKDVPILAVRACGHAISVNSKALELAGITADSPQPFGGEIVMENGQPNGILLDNAMDAVYNAIPVPDKETLKQMMRQACKALNSFGVTSCQSDDLAVFANLPWQTVLDAFRELENSGELTVRVYEQSNFSNIDDLKEFVETGNCTGVGTDFFRIGPLKMLGDGSLGARTAFLSHPYQDAPDTVGVPVFSQEEFDSMIGYANSKGVQVAVHAIGDGCLDRVILAVEKALEENPRADHRHGIVHCQITRPEQLRKLADMHMHIYAQSIFLDYDTHIVRQRVGYKLAATSYSWKMLLRSGSTVSNGTDCPVELPFALGGIQCAVTRQDLKQSAAPYLPEQAFTVQEAIDSYTSGSAYASFQENTKGKIQPGMLADFVVLGKNPFETDPGAIKDIPVKAVFTNGSCVYSA